MAITPDGPPSWLRWRDESLTITAGIGPERIAAEWWREANPNASALPTRDYFKVQDASGRWLWVYREIETGRWFLHGEWA